MALVAQGVPDPAAADSLPPGCVFGNPDVGASVLSLPAALEQAWHERRSGVPRGEVERHEIGTGAAASVVHVHRPNGATPEDDFALAVFFDGGTLLDLDIAATFDNLVHERAVEPLLAVVVESIHGSARRGPTRVESLTAPAEFETFVIAELVPYIAQRFRVTDDPARSVLIGQSLGGLAALWLAHGHPDRFGLFVEVGSEEAEVLAGNRRLRTILEDSADPFEFREYRGGHDYACWRGGIADGLIAQLGPRGDPGD
jgi:enterochelin esterase-like enzyme